jgi:hypothetical protein
MPNLIASVNNINFDPTQVKIHDYLTSKLVELGISKSDIEDKTIRLQTILYQIYWYDRLKNNPQEQQTVFDSFVNYLFLDNPTNIERSDLNTFFDDQVIINKALG